MVPTLNGRIQTRIAVLAVIGGLVQLALVPLLPGTGELSTGEVYRIAFAVLLWTILLGVVWEVLYHLLMQFRWEKDWPTLFGLVTLVNEGLLLWFLLRAGLLPAIPAGLAVETFVVDLLVVWTVAWLWVNGPMRVFSVHWRFRGGRLV